MVGLPGICIAEEMYFDHSRSLTLEKQKQKQNQENADIRWSQMKGTAIISYPAPALRLRPRAPLELEATISFKSTT